MRSEIRSLIPLTLVAVWLVPAAAQSPAGVRCDGPRDDYLGCALVAGNLPDLRSMRVGRNEMEIRFWSVSGMFMPDHMLVIRSRDDSASGRQYLIWQANMIDDSFARSRCGERWFNAAAGLCVAQHPAERNWSAVVRELDSLGLNELPGRPVGETPCVTNRRVPRPDGGVDHVGCAVVGDGFVYTLEVRRAGVYWRYEFPGIPDTNAVGFKRDGAILRLLTCRGWKGSDHACPASGAR